MPLRAKVSALHSLILKNAIFSGVAYILVLLIKMRWDSCEVPVEL